MAINSLSYAGSLILNQSVQALKNQMTVLQSQLTTGNKSTTYAGMGVNEGFAIAARSQLSGISAFTDTRTIVNSNIGVANTVLQAMNDIGKTIQNSANSSSQTLNTAGQSIAQQTASSQLSSMLGILNTQAGDRYLFSGTAVTTPSVASMDDIMNGTTTQAGLKQVIAERKQADVGTNGLGRLVINSPTGTSVEVAEDFAGSPFGLKLSSVSSSLTGGGTVTGPGGSPAGVTIDLGATNPNVGDKVSFTFNLPDGSQESIALTASSATPPPAGSFTIGVDTTATAANLKAALNTAIGTLANTSLVAASAMQAGNDFFNTTGTATGSVTNNQATVPAPISGATLLSGAAGTNSIGASFGINDTITVNGTAIKFVASGATGNELNINDNIQTLLTKIDSITGTSTPSTINGGVISIHTDDAASLSISSSNSTAFAALGFSGTATAVTPPLRIGANTTTAAGGVAANQATIPGPITGGTLLSGAVGTDSLSSSFGLGDTITVNGTPITFVTSGATGNQLNLTDSVQSLLSKIDSITGTSTPSAISGGVISLHTDNGSGLSVTSSNPAAFAALGFTATATGAAGSLATNQATIPGPINVATLLSGAVGTDSLSSSFGLGDTITVNGTPITFVAAGATGNQLNITDNVQTLLSKIDSITGTSTPSAISGGVITLHSDSGSGLSVTSSNPSAFAALGFTATATGVTTQPVSFTSGTPANTVKWYTGNPGPISTARASATARVDVSVKVEYGIQANEQAIRSQLQTLAVFSAVTTSTTNPNGAAQVSALSQRVTQALTPQTGKQSIQDIQTDLATAQATMSDATARQKQAQAMLQSIVDQTETISPDQVASQLLALQTSLQASYQTTSMLSQMSLVKYLPIG
jgi:flagellar hook-associated protein 3 FlgL